VLTKLSAHLLNFLVLAITYILKIEKKNIKRLDYFLTEHLSSVGGQSLLRQVTAKRCFQRLDNKVKHTGQDSYTEMVE